MFNVACTADAGDTPETPTASDKSNAADADSDKRQQEARDAADANRDKQQQEASLDSEESLSSESDPGSKKKKKKHNKKKDKKDKKQAEEGDKDLCELCEVKPRGPKLKTCTGCKADVTAAARDAKGAGKSKFFAELKKKGGSPGRISSTISSVQMRTARNTPSEANSIGCVTKVVLPLKPR